MFIELRRMRSALRQEGHVDRSCVRRRFALRQEGYVYRAAANPVRTPPGGHVSRGAIRSSKSLCRHGIREDMVLLTEDEHVRNRCYKHGPPDGGRRTESECN